MSQGSIAVITDTVKSSRGSKNLVKTQETNNEYLVSSSLSASSGSTTSSNHDTPFDAIFMALAFNNEGSIYVFYSLNLPYNY